MIDRFTTCTGLDHRPPQPSIKSYSTILTIQTTSCWLKRRIFRSIRYSYSPKLTISFRTWW